LGPLIQRHPVEKPWIRVILDIDLDVYQQSPAKECCAMADALLGERCSCPETSKSETLQEQGISKNFI